MRTELRTELRRTVAKAGSVKSALVLTYIPNTSRQQPAAGFGFGIGHVAIAAVAGSSGIGVLVYVLRPSEGGVENPRPRPHAVWC